MTTVETIKPVCIHCEKNTALTFLELITRCDDAGFHDEYMPIQDYSNADTCYQCYEDRVSEYAQAQFEIDNDL